MGERRATAAIAQAEHAFTPARQATAVVAQVEHAFAPARQATAVVVQLGAACCRRSGARRQ
ncbi:MAG: hypothetical protein M5R40_06640 [Anaerolineae bacterium]|nr:hypothetical protein [Anaerolineae bacterium]